MASSTLDNIPEFTLDQAFRWAVVLHSGTCSKPQQQAFDTWLGESALNQKAWQRIEMIDQEFDVVRPAAKSSTEALKRVSKQRQKVSRSKRLAGLLSIVLLLGMAWLFSPQVIIWQAEYATAYGEQQHIQLASGAELSLNSNTALDIDNSSGVTRVHLYRGEVLVDSSAAVPAQKPVIITTEGVFTPVGTRFNIRKLKQTSELIVSEGQVNIQLVGSASVGVGAEAVANQRWQVSAAQINQLAPSGLQPEAWVDGIIEANNARLGDVLDALNQNRRGWLHYDDATAELRVTGVFRLDDTDSALNALENSMPLSITRVSPWWVKVQVEK